MFAGLDKEQQGEKWASQTQSCSQKQQSSSTQVSKKDRSKVRVPLNLGATPTQTMA